MKFLDYAREWTIKGISPNGTGIHVRERVLELCKVLAEQDHSASSFYETVVYFYRLVSGYCRNPNFYEDIK